MARHLTEQLLNMSLLARLFPGGKKSKSRDDDSTSEIKEISAPIHVSHDIHVGIDQAGGLQGLPESWLRQLKAANITYILLCQCLFLF